MEFHVEQRSGVLVVAIVGSIDTLTAEEVSNFLGDQIAKNARLVVELSRVDYLSSAGLRVLLGTTKEARHHGGDLRLAAVDEPILEILEMAGFTSIIKDFPSIDAAVKSYDDD